LSVACFCVANDITNVCIASKFAKIALLCRQWLSETWKKWCRGFQAFSKWYISVSFIPLYLAILCNLCLSIFLIFVALLCRNHQPLQASLHHESGHMRRSFGCFLQPRMDSVIRFRNSIKINRSRAYYKSEESDITEGVVPSADGSAEAILVEGNLQNASPWWQQFPRRWVIVLLCFSSFLLCNMDRVSCISCLFSLLI